MPRRRCSLRLTNLVAHLHQSAPPAASAVTAARHARLPKPSPRVASLCWSARWHGIGQARRHPRRPGRGEGRVAGDRRAGHRGLERMPRNRCRILEGRGSPTITLENLPPTLPSALVTDPRQATCRPCAGSARRSRTPGTPPDRHEQSGNRDSTQSPANAASLSRASLHSAACTSVYARRYTTRMREPLWEWK